MKEIKGIYRILVLLGSIACLCTSCALKEMEEAGNQHEDNPTKISLEETDESQRIVFSYAENISMPKGAEMLIHDFTSDYYASFVDYQEPDLLTYFDFRYEKSAENAYINQLALAYLLGVRKAQELDLRLKDYECILEVIAIQETQDGLLSIEILEHSQIKYAFMPERIIYASGIKHEFILSELDDHWSILLHSKLEDIYYIAEEALSSEVQQDELGKIPGSSEDKLLWDVGKEIDIILLEEGYQEVLDSLMQEAKASILLNTIAYKQYLEGSDIQEDDEAAWDYEYNREKAIEYAYEWTGCCGLLRNPVWMAYDGLGGNCNNFISQCLYAGGIPMDITGSINNQWKWYEDYLDANESHSGRSSSWSGVDEFYEYAMNNEGPGLVAQVGKNIYCGQIGDIIQYGMDGEWNHSVIIVEIIPDENGKTIDYLINSNTTDRIDCPMSAYSYTDIRLIKILGYNKE